MHLRELLSATVLLLFASVSSVVLADVPAIKVALVIGNSKYQHVPILDNPTNDATEIAKALERIGFEVTHRLDLGFDETWRVLREYSKRSENADISLIYFAGHGIEIDKANYLLPVDAQMQDDQDVDLEAVQLRSALREVAGGEGITLMLVDACRDNPFASRLIENGATRSIGKGLVRVDPGEGVLPGGVLVSYAAKEGEFALDGVGRNSPYATALLQNLETPGLEISKLFRLVRDDVFELTVGLQEPFTYGSLPGRDIYLAAAPAPQASSPSLLQEPFLQSRPSEKFLRDYARAQRLDNAYLWKRFLAEHGSDSSNVLVEAAEARLAELITAEAERIAEENRLPWLIPEAGMPDAGEPVLSRAEAQSLQRSLNLLGFDTGGTDGQIGPMTRRAIFEARDRFGLTPGNRIDTSFLRKLPDPTEVEKLRPTKARTIKVSDLSSNLEPRLVRALNALEGREIVFGYFQRNLYLAVLPIGGDNWISINELAGASGGHLATIGSAAENEFIFRLFSQDRKFFLKDSKGYWRGPMFGLYQKDGSREPDGGWAWVTDEVLNYRNWSRGNPDDYSGRQKYGTFFVNGLSDANGTNLRFWDDTSGQLPAGYIFEIE